LGWLVIGVFQGYFTFVMSVIGLTGSGFSVFNVSEVTIPALLSTVMLLGSYPMTQIYQHQEDRKHGDITISLILGIMGTFHFTGVIFFISSTFFVAYYFTFYNLTTAVYFLIALTPVIGYFMWWYFNARKKPTLVNYINTMRLNLISSICLSTFFLGVRLF